MRPWNRKIGKTGYQKNSSETTVGGRRSPPIAPTAPPPIDPPLTGGKGRSRSLKMAPFDRTYTTYYWSVIASIALSCTVFLSYLSSNNVVTLKSR